VSCPACERKVFQGLLFPGRGCSSGCARQTLEAERQANTNPDTLRVCEPVGGPPINAGRFLTYPDCFPTTISRNPPCFIYIIATWPRFRIGGAKRSIPSRPPVRILRSRRDRLIKTALQP
jgi:hypothetical protein